VITAEQAADTLRLLVPGFIALKIFYLFGLRTRRSDLEWVIWSVLAAAAIDAVVRLIPAGGPTLLIAVALAVLFGLAAAVLWRLVASRRPAIRERSARMAWDAVLSKPRWVQVWMRDGLTISGHTDLVADPVETDVLDLYLKDAAWIGADNEVVPMTGVEGVVIGRDAIAFVQVLAPATEAASPGALSDRPENTAVKILPVAGRR
jgi:hypothetical protein